MGVPAFFRWMSQKYPKVMTPPTGQTFDNVYLDMNGIIHPASHPEDGPAPETEHDMYMAVLDYMDKVLACARPTKLLFIAIDGVAPRAKMNQQRARRFRSAQEMEENAEVAKQVRLNYLKEGKMLPPEEEKSTFDSNVITPGTPFMFELALYLQWFVHFKIDNDENWRNLKVIISDASVPGEGEHKIMEYIRLQRATSGYEPNTSHVIHGLDADLIMLGLATHEPNFFILREQVFFGPKPGQDSNTVALVDPGEKPFELVQISVLREYLYKEFQNVRFSDANCVFDLENVIDDFVLMCFFVGNDFLPHLPSLDIREGAIDTLLDIYKFSFREMGGYLTKNCTVNLKNVRNFMREIAYVEDQILKKRRDKEASFQRKRDQKARNIENKVTTQEHMRLIRECTSNVAAEAVALGGNQNVSNWGTSSTNQDEQARKRAKSAYDYDDFRIKNRAPGGIRVVAPGVAEMSARRLHMMDKIREFYEHEGPNAKNSKIELKGLTAAERACAHQYCEELDLVHKSEGQDAHRYIVVSRKEVDEKVAEGDLSEEAVKKRLEENTKQAVRDRNDKIADAQTDEVDLGRDGWKERYYENKMPHEDPDDVASHYIEGLVWVFKYYYEGCQSWNWFFPYHYAPFASDLTQLLIRKPEFQPEFELGKPFSPFEQLMSVFPAASKFVLPPKFQELMEEDSPIAEFYPRTFQLDLNGKRRLWQAVVLLPFIDEAKLLKYVKPLEDELTGADFKRNSLGEHKLFCHKNHSAAQLLKKATPRSEEPKEIPNPPDLKKLNELAADLLRAELSGDEELHAKLQQELQEGHRAAKECFEAMQKAKGLPLDPKLTNGMNGFVFKPEDAPAVDGLWDPGLFFTGNLQSHPYRPHTLTNMVYKVNLRFPTFKPHNNQLIPGTVIPPPQLLPEDEPVILYNFTRARKAVYQPHPHRGPRDTRPAQRMISHSIPHNRQSNGGSYYPPGKHTNRGSSSQHHSYDQRQSNGHNSHNYQPYNKYSSGQQSYSSGQQSYREYDSRPPQSSRNFSVPGGGPRSQSGYGDNSRSQSGYGDNSQQRGYGNYERGPQNDHNKRKREYRDY
eukprot:m.203123 g.203123  ORF g.203123 m.203123 type:complete len:1076 (+) comp15756_c1_seq1:222-3449(+)